MSVFYSSYPGTGGNSVTSLDGLTGALTLVAGAGISIVDGVSTITISSTSSGDVTLTAYGSTPNANGASLTGQALTLQPASGSFPGGVSTTTQTFAGSKTFSSIINADSGIDRSTSGTLTIGATNSTTINIGNSGATVNIQGTTIYENTPNLLVADPLITVNTGGGAGSGQNSGIEINENNVITGYAETSADRNSWILKAPNTAGIVTITPGASGFVINQASHDALTLAAVGSSPNANAASLSSQVLTLQPASASFPGVVTTGTQSIAGAKTFSTSAATPTLLLNGASSGALTLVAAATTTPYTVTFPSAQSTASATSYLANDGAGALSWIKTSDGPARILNYTFTLSVATNALTIALKTKAGTDPSATDPVTISFRSATATDGTYTTVQITAATSIVVPASATLGRNAVSLDWPLNVWFINNSGTAELAVSTSPAFPTIVTTTAITSGSTTRTTMYSTSARTSVPMVSAAVMTVNLANNSNYTAVPTEVVLTNGILDVADARTGSPLTFKTSALGGLAMSGMAIGPNAMSESSTSIAIGSSAIVNTSSTSGIAIGASASSSGTDSLALGDGANGSAASTVAIGASAAAAGASAISIGTNSSAKGASSIAIGGGAGDATGGSGNVSIGAGVSAGTFTNSIAIGPGPNTTTTVAPTANNQLTIGDSRTSGQISDIRLGRGAVAVTTAIDVTMGITPISGADATGKNFILQAGNGTGAGGSGQILFQTAPVAGSSSTADTMATRGGWDNAGGLFINGTTSGAVTLKAAATTTNHILTMPSAQGAASSVLTNNGSGALSWVALGTKVESTFVNAAWPITAGQYGDLASVSLTAGTWSISFLVYSDNNGVITTTDILIGVGTVTGNDSTGVDLTTNTSRMTPVSSLASGAARTFAMADFTVAPGSTTIYYLKGTAATSITNLRAGGRLTAIRIA